LRPLGGLINREKGTGGGALNKGEKEPGEKSAKGKERLE